MTNQELMEKYPFLRRRDYQDNLVENSDSTYLDDMPEGWKTAFGEMICEDIKQALEKDNLLNDYRVEEVKEKFGGLRWYDYGANKAVNDIVVKYEHVSQHVCAKCGNKNATMYQFNGWYTPYCTYCAAKIAANVAPDKSIYDFAVRGGNDINKAVCQTTENGTMVTYELDCSDIVNRLK